MIIAFVKARSQVSNVFFYRYGVGIVFAIYILVSLPNVECLQAGSDGDEPNRGRDLFGREGDPFGPAYGQWKLDHDAMRAAVQTPEFQDEIVRILQNPEERQALLAGLEGLQPPAPAPVEIQENQPLTWRERIRGWESVLIWGAASAICIILALYGADAFRIIGSMLLEHAAPILEATQGNLDQIIAYGLRSPENAYRLLNTIYAIRQRRFQPEE